MSLCHHVLFHATELYVLFARLDVATVQIQLLDAEGEEVVANVALGLARLWIDELYEINPAVLVNIDLCLYRMPPERLDLRLLLFIDKEDGSRLRCARRFHFTPVLIDRDGIALHILLHLPARSGKQQQKEEYKCFHVTDMLKVMRQR